MKKTATYEEVRQAFLVDKVDKYLETTAKNLNGEIGSKGVKRIVNRAKYAAKISADVPVNLDELAARLIKGAYILGYVDSIRHHDVAAREALEELFESGEGATDAEHKRV